MYPQLGAKSDGLRASSADRPETDSRYSAPGPKLRVHPLAIKAMNELGIDISSHRSKTIDELGNEHFDYVITVCDRANESCPVFPAPHERIHWSFEDPSQAKGSEAEKLRAFRAVRDAIAGRLRLFQTIERRRGG